MTCKTESGPGVALLGEHESRPSTERASARYYRPELNVLRFLAFLFVFMAHNLPRSATPYVEGLLGSFVRPFYAAADACIFGVSLFFTLSAFLICELLLREKKETGTVLIKEFYIRRILRIWPLYYLGLAIGVLFAFTPLGNRSEVSHMGWYLIFMGAWHSAIYAWLDNPMFVLWSVSVEEQFYLFVPWLVRFMHRRSLFTVSLTLMLVSNLWIYRLSAGGATEDRLWADSIAQLQCFAAGILLCLILRGRIPQIAAWLRLLLFVGGAACWFYASYGPMQATGAPSPFPSSPYFIGYLAVSLGSVMMLLAFLGLPPRLLPRWAVTLGRISFGLYVFHVLAQSLISAAVPPQASMRLPLFLLRLCATFALTVAMAFLSYRYFEKPFLRLKSRHTVIQSQPV